jgi:D-glycero-D-manno-heptose 1,7-bisphosphate phosphatase
MTGERDGQFEITHSGALKWLVVRPPAPSRRAIFLDRDGVINRRIVGGYVTTWSEFHFLAGALDGIARLAAGPSPIIVVSNQAGVGKGLVSVSSLAEITNRFVSTIERAGGRVDAVYYCPHTPADACECRKPKPGLLLEAQRDWGLDLAGSVFLGDSATDAEAGRAAGCEVVLAADDVGLHAAWQRLDARADRSCLR